MRAGLLERLTVIFELHAGSRDARLGTLELQYLTQTLLALSIAAVHPDVLLGCAQLASVYRTVLYLPSPQAMRYVALLG